jgi:hypothetical protein
VDAAGVGRATLCCAALCCAVTECYLLSASLHILAHQQSLHTIPQNTPDEQKKKKKKKTNTTNL